MSIPVKIATLVPYRIYPAKMGGQKAIALFYRYLQNHVPVTVISTENNKVPAEVTSFLPLLNNSVSRYINLLLFFKIKKIIRHQQFSHLVIEHPYFGWLGWLLKKSTGIKLVVRSHNIEALRFKSIGKWWWRMLWRYEGFVHRHADLNFFITEEDRQFAIENYSVKKERCHTVTYGTEVKQLPANPLKTEAKKYLQETHNIAEEDRILLFNGTLDYKPNEEALDIILEKINPLLKKTNFRYKIIICGSKLPARFGELKSYNKSNVIYAGFINDINTYFLGADIFINPVSTGGGIKTKLVEALGANLSSISTASGAIGVPLEAGGEKLKIITDGDWNAFSAAIISTDPAIPTPNTFFRHFYWGNIAAKAAILLNETKAQ